MKMLWCMNVYSRLWHLRAQQDLLRLHFGNDLHILTFCNNVNLSDEQLKYKENTLIRCTVNDGHHRGSLHAYNAVRAMLHDIRSNGFDTIVWAQADTLFTDYSLAQRAIDLTKGGGCVVLMETERTHPREHWRGVMQWTYDHFFAMDVNSYEKFFPLMQDRKHTNGDIYDPVEVVLGEAMKCTGINRIVIPCNYDWNIHPNEYSELFGTQHAITCDNDVEYTLNTIRRCNPSYAKEIHA